MEIKHQMGTLRPQSKGVRFLQIFARSLEMKLETAGISLFSQACLIFWHPTIFVYFVRKRKRKVGGWEGLSFIISIGEIRKCGVLFIGKVLPANVLKVSGIL